MPEYISERVEFDHFFDPFSRLSFWGQPLSSFPSSLRQTKRKSAFLFTLKARPRKIWWLKGEEKRREVFTSHQVRRRERGKDTLVSRGRLDSNPKCICSFFPLKTSLMKTRHKLRGLSKRLSTFKSNLSYISPLNQLSLVWGIARKRRLLNGARRSSSRKLLRNENWKRTIDFRQRMHQRVAKSAVFADRNLEEETHFSNNFTFWYSSCIDLKLVHSILILNEWIFQS